MNENGLSERLKELRRDVKASTEPKEMNMFNKRWEIQEEASYRDFAKYLGYEGYSRFHSYEQKGEIPETISERIYQKMDVNSEWLKNGKEPKHDYERIGTDEIYEMLCNKFSYLTKTIESCEQINKIFDAYMEKGEDFDYMAFRGLTIDQIKNSNIDVVEEIKQIVEGLCSLNAGLRVILPMISVAEEFNVKRKGTISRHRDNIINQLNLFEVYIGYLKNQTDITKIFGLDKLLSQNSNRLTPQATAEIISILKTLDNKSKET